MDFWLALETPYNSGLGASEEQWGWVAQFRRGVWPIQSGSPAQSRAVVWSVLVLGFS